MKKDLIDIRDLSQEEIDNLITTAEDIIAHPEAWRDKTGRSAMPGGRSRRLPSP